MSVSTDGTISFGIKFDVDTEFPWDVEPYNGDLESWWLKVNKYEPPFELYTADGVYIDGVAPSRNVVDAYWRAKRDFIEAHPIPIDPVNYCSDGYPMWIFSAAGTDLGMVASRGEPVTFDPATLVATEDTANRLRDFCQTYGIDTKGAEPSWWLSSYWGS